MNANVSEKSVEQLMKDTKLLSDFELSKTDLAGFEKFARKHKIDYQVRLDEKADPPKYTVFFKSRDGKDMEAAFRGYLNSILKKEQRPSVVQTLRKLVEQDKLLVKKQKEKSLEKSL